MPITRDSPFITPPRISRGQFQAVLAEAGSPWAARGGAIFDLIADAGQDPGVWLAICALEHAYGTNRDSVLWRNDTRSWTNARTVRDPGISGWEIITDSQRGSHYVRYADVLDSVRDGLYRITDPGYRYVREGRRTIAEVFAIWTEGDSDGYARGVVRLMNEWIDADPDPSPTATQGVPGQRGEGLFDLGGLTDLVDARHLLVARERDDGVRAGPFERRTLGEKRGLVVHYSGPPVGDRANTLAVLQAEARYHVGKNWAAAGDAPLYGDGLMYHVAVGDDGTAWLCRDPEAVLWHCGAWPQNALALAVHVPVGGEQRATPAQLATLLRIADEWRSATGTPLSEVWGHQELSPTACPGTLMADFIHPYREGRLKPVADGQFFAETGHFVGGGFWRYWRERGGLPIFGYPLTEELRENDRTVQYFERAVFEYHPANPEPYTVLLRRLGAEALERRG